MKRLVLIALVLAGCDGKDYGECLLGHSESYTWMMPVGNACPANGGYCPIYVPMQDTQMVCDVYEYPNGDGPEARK